MGIADKSRELLPQFRFFLKNIRGKAADRPVEHENDHVLSLPVQMDDLLLRRFRRLIRILFRQPPDLRNLSADGKDIRSGHSPRRQRGNHADQRQKHRFLFPQNPYKPRRRQQDAPVDQLLPRADQSGHIRVIDIGGGHIAVSVPEKKAVDHGSNGQDGCPQAEIPPFVFCRQQIKDGKPDQEEPRRHQKRPQHQLQRGPVGTDFHKFSRRGVNNRRRNHQSRENRQQDAATEEDRPVVLPLPENRPFLLSVFLLPKRQRRRNLQKDRRRDSPDRLPDPELFSLQRHQDSGRQPHG